MSLGRYSEPDDYTIEELLHEFRSANATGRIDLLRRLQREPEEGVPRQIAQAVVEDSDGHVRAWFARNARGMDLVGDLEDRLRGDLDPYVRASLLENEHSHSSHAFGPLGTLFSVESAVSSFRHLTHMERLALMRHPGVSHELVEKVFDPTDKELEIDLEPRAELVLAFLTNRKRIEESRNLYIRYSPEDYKSSRLNSHFARLWTLASMWLSQPNLPDLRVPSFVYRHLGAHDRKKADIYRACPAPFLREQILRNCAESDTQTLALGLKDDDEDCRSIAESKTSAWKSKSSKFWPRFGYAARVLADVLVLVLVVLLLRKASAGFEIIAFSFLTIIILLAWKTQHALAPAMLAGYEAMTDNFRKIRDLLSHNVSSEVRKEEAVGSLERNREIRKMEIHALIDEIVSLLIMVVLLYHLFSDLRLL